MQRCILTTVHPHACGEIATNRWSNRRSNGTSPRLWGDSNITSMASPTRRYIPTLVGRFFAFLCAGLMGAVHPHACGEILLFLGAGRAFAGTSPRLWGDYEAASGRYHRNRYIPTLVGRFRYFRISIDQKPVHPHACGEIGQLLATVSRDPGTSPRLWGDSDRDTGHRHR